MFISMRPTSREAKGPCTGVIYRPHQNETKGKNTKIQTMHNTAKIMTEQSIRKCSETPAGRASSGQDSPCIKTRGLDRPPPL